jgi:hypothetical protein
VKTARIRIIKHEAVLDAGAFLLMNMIMAVSPD